MRMRLNNCFILDVLYNFHDKKIYPLSLSKISNGNHHVHLHCIMITFFFSKIIIIWALWKLDCFIFSARPDGDDVVDNHETDSRSRLCYIYLYIYIYNIYNTLTLLLCFVLPTEHHWRKKKWFRARILLPHVTYTFYRWRRRHNARQEGHSPGLCKNTVFLGVFLSFFSYSIVEWNWASCDGRALHITMFVCNSSLSSESWVVFHTAWKKTTKESYHHSFHLWLRWWWEMAEGMWKCSNQKNMKTKKREK